MQMLPKKYREVKKTKQNKTKNKTSPAISHNDFKMDGACIIA